MKKLGWTLEESKEMMRKLHEQDKAEAPKIIERLNAKDTQKLIKRINGKTYNANTAKEIDGYEGDISNPSEEYYVTLHKKRTGEHFVCQKWMRFSKLYGWHIKETRIIPIPDSAVENWQNNFIDYIRD